MLNIRRLFSGAKIETTLGDLLEKWSNHLQKNNITEARESVEHILASIVNSRNVFDVYRFKNKIVGQEDINKVEIMCQNRLKRMPIQYILKEWDFRTLTLTMSPPVFIPRPETEIIVQLVLDEIKRSQAKNILDLCCGSGAISLALLKENSTIKVTAIDQSSKACLLTKENAQKHKLTERLYIHQNKIGSNNLFFIKDTKFDVIVSNPPYIFSANINNLQAEIKLYEDLAALDGGEDGLEIIKLILKMSLNLLKTGGKLFLEVDPLHPEMIKNWIEKQQFCDELIFLKSHKDYAGKDRFVELIKN